MYNNQTSSTAAPFQQMLEVDSAQYSQYEAPNLQNVEFFYANGTIIPSWMEGDLYDYQTASNLYQDSATTYWLRIGPHIEANTNMVIYMGFAANGTNLFNGTTVGEAPWLSPSYGQYDNGAAVFLSYFDGLTPITNFSMAPGFGINTQDVVYGSNIIPVIHMYGTLQGENVYFIYNQPIPNQPVIEETNFQSLDPQADTGFVGLAGTLPSSTNVAFSYIGYTHYGVSTPQAGNYTYPASASSSWLYGTLYYFQRGGFLAYAASTLYNGYDGLPVQGRDPLSNDLRFFIGSATWLNTTNYTDEPVDIYFNFARVRAYPPDGVMPAVQFGSVSGTVSTTTTSISTTIAANTSTSGPTAPSVPLGTLLPIVAVIVVVVVILLIYRRYRDMQEERQYSSHDEPEDGKADKPTY